MIKSSEIVPGMRFGRLETIRVDQSKSRNSSAVYWVCQCDCGNTKSILASSLTRGTTRSCGCLHREGLQNRNHKHGLSRHPLYTHWCAMKQRCDYPGSEFYYCYGGRGIRVCCEWENDFLSFFQWSMSHGYHDGLTLDRIDPNGNYCPENCRWATDKDQANNTTKNHWIVYNNERMTIAQASERYYVPYHTLKARINTLHWSVEKAIETPVRNAKHRFVYHGKEYTGEEISLLFGFSKPYAGYLLKNGLTHEQVIDYLIEHAKEQ